jgi:hypothetical protein
MGKIFGIFFKKLKEKTFEDIYLLGNVIEQKFVLGLLGK